MDGQSDLKNSDDFIMNIQDQYPYLSQGNSSKISVQTSYFRATRCETIFIFSKNSRISILSNRSRQTMLLNLIKFGIRIRAK